MFKKTETALSAMKTELERVATELAGARAELRALQSETDHTEEINALKRKKAQLEIDISKIEETNARKLREVTHATGLLKTQQEQDVAHQTREAVLKVREENLEKDKQRFKDEMEFQREHLQKEVDRVEAILGKVLDRLPDVTAHLEHTTKAK